MIRVRSIQGVSDDADVFNGVQLSSKGIAVIQTKTDDPELSGSIENKVSEAKPGGLSAETYAKIGAL